ncbi:MAG: hypothetical protein OXH97_04895 [Chloroflexota bacterium]|nr:hypothetical protein [Chloroflexota bacterium]MDE2695837.1 hypothetical protein [Chloroflexota bacterium]
MDLRAPAVVVAQAWRNSDGRQARLARLLRTVEIVVVDLDLARRAGQLLGRSATADPIDAMVVLVAKDEDAILTTDPDDIAHLAAAAQIRAAVIPC